MKNQLLIAAYEYITNGICVIPTNENKIPCIKSWKKYQEEVITMEEAETGFELPYAKTLSVVCGKSSQNLEVIDIDCKYDLTGKLFENYLKDIADNDQELHDSLLVIKTRSGGYHLYYRCEKIEGNQKLAQREATAEEMKLNPGDKVRVLIETRGQGGYVVAPPSEGYTIQCREKDTNDHPRSARYHAGTRQVIQRDDRTAEERICDQYQCEGVLHYSLG